MSFTTFGIRIGPITLSYFGLILIAAMAVGGYIAYRRAQQRGEDPEIVVDALTWGLILGVIVARLFYILNPPPSQAEFHDRRWFLTHPFDLQAGPLAIWSGGLGTAGALVGGLLGVFILLRRRRADRWKWADILTPGALAGMAIAAWSNVANQQMYGPPTSLPWGVSILSPVSPYHLLPPETRFHPTPAYISLWALIVLGVVTWIERRYRLRKGELFLLAVLIYMPGLFVIDFFPIDVSHPIPGLTGMQILAIVMFGWAAAMLARRRRAQAMVEVEPSAPAETEPASTS